MTKEEALHSFWSSFELPAYEENSVYAVASPQMPYITYEVATGDFNTEIPLTASLWYDSYSWGAPNTKKSEIAAAIGNGGVIIPCDGGYIWLKRSGRFAQNTGDSTSDTVKRVILNVTVEFFTEN